MKRILFTRNQKGQMIPIIDNRKKEVVRVERFDLRKDK